MTQRLFWISIFTFGYIYLNACSNLAPFKQNDPIGNKIMTDSNYQKISYDTTILLIDKKCETCETWDALFSIKEFLDLYEHSAFYMIDGLSFLSNNSYNDRQKKYVYAQCKRLRLKVMSILSTNVKYYTIQKSFLRIFSNGQSLPIFQIVI
jgi:hypothetical protein